MSDVRDARVEEVAAAYLTGSEGNADEALRAAVADALAVAELARRQRAELERLVSRGYARGPVLVEDTRDGQGTRA